MSLQSHFFQIFWDKLISVFIGWSCTKNYVKMYVIRNNNDVIRVHITQWERCYSVLPKTLVSCTSHYIALNITKSYIQCTYFKICHWYNFCWHSFLKDAVFTIFPEFSEKGRSWFYSMQSLKKLFAKNACLEIIFVDLRGI